MVAQDIIIKPILSEKSYDGISAMKYTFEVNPKASRTQIKKAIEEIFNVQVDSVNTINVKGKLKKQGRTQGYTAKRKKAIIQLKASSKPIAEFESLA